MSEESSTPTTHCPNCKKIASSCGGGGEAANEGYANCLACDVTWEADAQTRNEIVRLWRAGALAGDGRIAKAGGFAEGASARAGVNERWLVELLERFRERCAEEGAVGCDRDHSANNPADRIRAIDVAAWLVDAKPKERTDDAVRRALDELFAAYNKELEDIARVAIEQIEGALHDGAIGMRDACLILVRAAGQGQPRYIAAAMDALRRSIETLPA